MSKKIRLTLFVLTVFIFGVVAGFVFSQVWWMRGAMSPYYGTSLTEIAIDAQQLHQDMADHVLKRKVMALTPLTQSYYNVFFKFMPDDRSRYNPLWQVRRYYEISGNDVPAPIKPILASLPPRPLTSCELKRLEEDQQDTPKTKD